MRHIERMQSISFDTYMAPSPLGFIMQQTLLYISSSLLILIGLEITLIASPHLITHSVLVPSLSVSREISKMPLLYLQLRQSTEG